MAVLCASVYRELAGYTAEAENSLTLVSDKCAEPRKSSSITLDPSQSYT